MEKVVNWRQESVSVVSHPGGSRLLCVLVTVLSIASILCCVSSYYLLLKCCYCIVLLGGIVVIEVRMSFPRLMNDW